MSKRRVNLRIFLRWENFFYGLTVLAAVVVTILGFLQVITSNTLNVAILLVLTAITALLLESHIVITRLKIQLESPSIVKMLRPYGEFINEIRERIESAEEFWFLSRSGLKFVRSSYKDELDRLMIRGKARYLLLSPGGGAIKMVEDCQEERLDKIEVIFRHQNIYKEFLTQLNKKCINGNSQLKVIDHLSAWTLYIFDPLKKNGEPVIYVELATYRPRPAGRPVFKITLQDGDYFNMFLDEFNTMWEIATDWKPTEIESGPAPTRP